MEEQAEAPSSLRARKIARIGRADTEIAAAETMSLTRAADHPIQDLLSVRAPGVKGRLAEAFADKVKIDNGRMHPAHARELRIRRAVDLVPLAHVKDQREAIVLPQPCQVLLRRIKKPCRAQQKAPPDAPPVPQDDAAELAGISD